jgi:predicted 2-oxoglutarate/Fe(II)-dependent dioxygenase YbiX
MQNFCRTVPALLSNLECRDFIKWGEDNRYRQTGQDYPSSYRNNDRMVFHDVGLAATLMSRLNQHLPQRLTVNGATWTLDGLNPLFRGCRYRHGQNFTRHRDGAHSPDQQRRSLLTVMLYLNDARDFQGGATRFYADRFTESSDFEVKPEEGLGILFAHDYWHDGQAVTEGTKYVLRTDVVYRTQGPQGNGHRGYIWDVKQLPCGHLVSGSRDKTIRVWSLAPSPPRQPRHLQTLHGHESSVTCLASSPRGFLSGGRDRKVISWLRQKDGSFQQERVWKAHDGALLCLRSLPDGRLLSCGADGLVKLWSEVGEPLAHICVDSWPWCMEPSPVHPEEIFLGTESGHVLALPQNLSSARTVFYGEHRIQALKSLPSGLVLSGNEVGQLTRFTPHRDAQNRTTELHPVHTQTGHRGPITSIAYLKCGTVVTGAEDDGVRVWLADSSVELTRHNDFVRALCVTDNQEIVSASYDGNLQLSNPSAILRTERAAKPGGAISGTAAAS